VVRRQSFDEVSGDLIEETSLEDNR
jgi:hypothetical protein